MRILIPMALAMVASGPALAGNPDSIVGKWRTQTRGGIVEIAPCGASICGRIVDSEGLRADPDLRDVNNKQADKRARKVQNLQILGGFKREADKWSGGTIYNAEDGGTYNAIITPDGPDRLKLKGCVVWPLCKTQTWTRLK